MKNDNLSVGLSDSSIFDLIIISIIRHQYHLYSIAYVDTNYNDQSHPLIVVSRLIDRTTLFIHSALRQVLRSMTTIIHGKYIFTVLYKPLNLILIFLQKHQSSTHSF